MNKWIDEWMNEYWHHQSNRQQLSRHVHKCCRTIKRNYRQKIALSTFIAYLRKLTLPVSKSNNSVRALKQMPQRSIIKRPHSPLFLPQNIQQTFHRVSLHTLKSFRTSQRSSLFIRKENCIPLSQSPIWIFSNKSKSRCFIINGQFWDSNSSKWSQVPLC